MLDITLIDDVPDLASESERTMMLAAFAMAFRRASRADSGTVTIRFVPRMDVVPGLGLEPNGYVDPQTGDTTLNLGHLLRNSVPSDPAVFAERAASLILIAAHEGTHVGQVVRGDELPNDDVAAAEYRTDPAYEREAREISVDVLAGAYPGLHGELPMGTSGRLYQIPTPSTFAAEWTAFAAGRRLWTLHPVHQPLAQDRGAALPPAPAPRRRWKRPFGMRS
jgi:hypothetical protein